MGRRGAAATADDPHAEGDHFLVIGSHLSGSRVKHRFAINELRQSGIGLGDEGPVGHLTHLLQHLKNSIHTEAAIGADDVDPQGIESYRSSLRRGPEHRTTSILKGHQGHDRQVGELPAGNNRGP